MDKAKQYLTKKFISFQDSLNGVEGTWIFFQKSELSREELALCRDLILEQLSKNGKRVWFMNPDGQPVAEGHFELNEEFWSK